MEPLAVGVRLSIPRHVGQSAATRPPIDRRSRPRYSTVASRPPEARRAARTSAFEVGCSPSSRRPGRRSSHLPTRVISSGAVGQRRARARRRRCRPSGAARAGPSERARPPGGRSIESGRLRPGPVHSPRGRYHRRPGWYGRGMRRRAQATADCEPDASGDVSMAEVEIFTPTGVARRLTAGVRSRPATARISPPPLVVDEARWYPTVRGPGRAAAARPRLPRTTSSCSSPRTRGAKVHMTWFAVTLDLGPYRVSGEPRDPSRLRPGAMPSPDPAAPSCRSATRTIELVGEADGGSAERAYVHVNRYAVERVRLEPDARPLLPGRSARSPRRRPRSDNGASSASDRCASLRHAGAPMARRHPVARSLPADPTPATASWQSRSRPHGVRTS